MKCLSVRQPWATLIVMGLKDVENRRWVPRHRGRLLIHAGASMTVSDLDYLARKYGIELDRSSLVLGAILGAVDLIDCKKKASSRWHVRGQFGWYLTDPRRLRTPIPYKGQLGIFEVPNRLLPRSWQ